MKSKINIIIAIFLLAFLFTTPIISSTSLKIKGSTILRQINNEITLNPKVIEILDKINETMLINYLQDIVNIGPRSTGTYGCEKAAEYIYEQFKSTGLHTRYQPWESWGSKGHNQYYKSKNVEATQYGTNKDWDEVIVFNAHYDTIRRTVGANDDGSGTASVLAAAYVLSQYEFNRTFKFVTFSGEEIGLRGSRAYAKELYDKDIDLVVEFNADMIGYATTYETGHKLRLSMSEDTHWIAEIADTINDGYNLDFTIERYTRTREGRGGSDYFEFLQYGYESIAYWPGEWDPNMHKPTDTIDKINFSYLTNMTRFIAGTMAILGDVPIPIPQAKIANPKLGKLYKNDRTLLKFKYNRTIFLGKSWVTAEIKPGNSPIERVEFYYDDKLEYTDSDLPYQWWLDKTSLWFHKLKVIAYDESGQKSTDEIKIFYINKKDN
jgi:hypothetical protein